MSGRFRVVCFTCRRHIIDPLRATIHVPFAEVRAAAKAMKAWEQRHPGPGYSAGDLFNMPDEVPWRLDCDTCNPHRDADGSMCGDCYWFTVDRCHTWAQLVNWTAHLAGKAWLERTDWFEFIRAISDGSSLVGLIAAPTERTVHL